MKIFTDADYKHARRVLNDFELRHIDRHQDLYVQHDHLLLANVFKNSKFT